ncbi:unnamed protein product [[Candida] boidinii]|nr:unnamed protein product [[Candida] boidinii]
MYSDFSFQSDTQQLPDSVITMLESEILTATNRNVFLQPVLNPFNVDESLRPIDIEKPYYDENLDRMIYPHREDGRGDNVSYDNYRYKLLHDDIPHRNSKYEQMMTILTQHYTHNSRLMDAVPDEPGQFHRLKFVENWRRNEEMIKNEANNGSAALSTSNDPHMNGLLGGLTPQQRALIQRERMLTQRQKEQMAAAVAATISNNPELQNSNRSSSDANSTNNGSNSTSSTNSAANANGGASSATGGAGSNNKNSNNDKNATSGSANGAKSNGTASTPNSKAKDTKGSKASNKKDNKNDKVATEKTTAKKTTKQSKAHSKAAQAKGKKDSVSDSTATPAAAAAAAATTTGTAATTATPTAGTGTSNSDASDDKKKAPKKPRKPTKKKLAEQATTSDSTGKASSPTANGSSVSGKTLPGSSISGKTLPGAVDPSSSSVAPNPLATQPDGSPPKKKRAPYKRKKKDEVGSASKTLPGAGA